MATTTDFARPSATDAENEAESTSTTRAQKLQSLGAIAAATETVSPEVRHAVIEQRLPSHDWPDRVLRLTAIDVATGELVVFDRESGVGLVDAVAASCAVPGAWPPVTIAGRRYMDGGVASSVNLGVAGDCDAAVVLVPSGADAPAPFGDGPAAEIRSALVGSLRAYVETAAICGWMRWTTASAWSRSFCPMLVVVDSVSFSAPVAEGRAKSEVVAMVFSRVGSRATKCRSDREP